MWSQIGDKIAMLVHKVTLKKKEKKEKPKKIKNLKAQFFFKANLMTHWVIF